MVLTPRSPPQRFSLACCKESVREEDRSVSREQSGAVSVGDLVAIFTKEAEPMVGEVLATDALGIRLSTFDWRRVNYGPWEPVESCGDTFLPWTVVSSIRVSKPDRRNEFIKQYGPSD
jgi:hypothetical protein